MHWTNCDTMDSRELGRPCFNSRNASWKWKTRTLPLRSNTNAIGLDVRCRPQNDSARDSTRKARFQPSVDLLTITQWAEMLGSSVSSMYVPHTGLSVYATKANLPRGQAKRRR